jgi:hypothetical protein
MVPPAHHHVDDRLPQVLELLEPRSVLDLDSDPGALERGGRHDLVVSRAPVEMTTSLGELLVLAGSALLLAGDQRLADSLASIAPRIETFPLGNQVLLVLLPAVEPHPRDLPAARLRALAAVHPEPVRLAQLRLAARGSTRCLPDEDRRAWEYPLVADRVLEHTTDDARVADLQPGVSPLPVFLSRADRRVDTVDPSPVRRDWPPRPEWDVHDSVDYAGADLAEASFNCALQDVPADRSYAAISAVAVLERLPAQDRRSMLEEIGRRLDPGGVVVLTLGRSQEGDASLDELLAAVHDELQGAGLDPVEEQTVRDWGSERSDVALLVARRPW